MQKLLAVIFFLTFEIQSTFPIKIESKTLEDGSKITKYSDGSEVIQYSDGKVICNMPNGDKVIYYVDGVEEIIRARTNIREKHFKDGSIQTIFLNGDAHTQNLDGTRVINMFSAKTKVFFNANGEIERKEALEKDN